MLHRLIFAKVIDLSDLLDQPAYMSESIKDCSSTWVRDDIDEYLATPAGQWAVKNTRLPLIFDTSINFDSNRVWLRIGAHFTQEDYTFWKLKYL